MENITINVPMMFADHHVIEVRRILFEVPGVEDVYASSAFGAVEITFDPEKVDINALETKLGEAGYLGGLSLPVEAGEAAYLAEDTPSYFRHTEIYETAQDMISFAQEVNQSGRPLWNCPGVGVIKTTMED